MKQSQLTLNIDALTQNDWSQYIKDDIVNESMHMRWAHFHDASSDARFAQSQHTINAQTTHDIINIDDFSLHCMSANDILNMLQDALYQPGDKPKLLVTTSYMPIEDFCQYLIDNINCSTQTKLNIAAIFEHVHNYEMISQCA